jgi:hypothetical protein
MFWMKIHPYGSFRQVATFPNNYPSKSHDTIIPVYLYRHVYTLCSRIRDFGRAAILQFFASRIVHDAFNN